MPIKTLPIGTVVQLVDVKEKVMICGRQQINEEDGLTYDYSGCPFPSGFDGENIFLFQSKSSEGCKHRGKSREKGGGAGSKDCRKKGCKECWIGTNDKSCAKGNKSGKKCSKERIKR